jgi:hypothetical protein
MCGISSDLTTNRYGLRLPLMKRSPRFEGGETATSSQGSSGVTVLSPEDPAACFYDPCPRCGSWEATEDEDEPGAYWCQQCGSRVE